MRPMAETKPTATADELLRMPDDGYRYELVRGELRRMSPAGYRHGVVAMRLGLALGLHVETENLGEVCAAETGFRLDMDLVRAPDVAFVRRERLDEHRTPTGYWPGAPDLAVEIVSPNDTFSRVQEKVFDWLDAGARMVLIADPRKRTVTEYRSRDDVRILTETSTIEGHDVVPGWTLPVERLFAR